MWSCAAPPDLCRPGGRAIHAGVCSFSKLLFIAHAPERRIPVGHCSFQAAALDTVSKTESLSHSSSPRMSRRKRLALFVFVLCFSNEFHGYH